MRLTAVVAAILMISGCGPFPFRRAKTPPPPGPTPVRIPDQVTSVEPAPAPKNLPAPPAIGPLEAGGKNTTATKALGLPPTPNADPPARPQAKSVPEKRAAAPPPVVPQAAPEAPAEINVAITPPFRLGELRSAEEKEELLRQTEQMLARCVAALSAIEGRSLTAMQAEMVSRVRAFAQQAREAMNKDIGEARNFAAKGRTFAEALLAELK